MLLAIVAAVGPFLINAAVELVKWLTQWSSTPAKRFILAGVAILGSISFSALNGTPLDINSVSSLGQVAFDALTAFFAAHGTYTLITGKTAAAGLPNA
jgi:hypothetical protein